MTNAEVRKRIYKVLNQLSCIGCLSVYEQVSRTSHLTKESEDFINRIVVRFNSLFRDYEVKFVVLFLHLIKNGISVGNTRINAVQTGVYGIVPRV